MSSKYFVLGGERLSFFNLIAKKILNNNGIQGQQICNSGIGFSIGGHMATSVETVSGGGSM